MFSGNICDDFSAVSNFYLLGDNPIELCKIKEKYLMGLSRDELIKLDLKLVSDYGDIIPKIQIAYDLFNLIENNTGIDRETKIYLKEKAVICHQKIKMMLFAEKCAIENLNEFEISQNMEMPCLFGDDETTLLYHTESTILFARNALDVVATIFHHITFHERCDSFNKFTKKVLKDKSDNFIRLKSYISEIDKLDTHAFRLLCGSEKGRALRDQIVHQTNISLEYDEYKEGSDKEKLFIMLDKGEVMIPYREFMRGFAMEVVEMISFISQNITLDELNNQL